MRVGLQELAKQRRGCLAVPPAAIRPRQLLRTGPEEGGRGRSSFSLSGQMKTGAVEPVALRAMDAPPSASRNQGCQETCQSSHQECVH